MMYSYICRFVQMFHCREKKFITTASVLIPKLGLLSHMNICMSTREPKYNMLNTRFWFISPLLKVALKRCSRPLQNYYIAHKFRIRISSEHVRLF